MRRSNCSSPIPPLGIPRDITFFLVAPILLSLYFFLAPPYINTLITLFSSAQRLVLIYHTHFSSDPGAAPWGRMGVEQFDRRINVTYKYKMFTKYEHSPLYKDMKIPRM